MMNQNTRHVIVLVAITAVLTLMAANFGASYAAIGALAMIARTFIRPSDLLHVMPGQVSRDAPFITANFEDAVTRLAGLAHVRPPHLLHRPGKRATAMVLGSQRESAILFRGAVHGLTEAEREALVAHEIGHVARNHFLIKWATTSVLLLAFISLARWHVLRENPALTGTPFLAPHVGMAFLITATVAFVAHEWIGYLIEAEADDQAVRLLGSPVGIIAMLRRELPAAPGPIARLTMWPIVQRIHRLQSRA